MTRVTSDTEARTRDEEGDVPPSVSDEPTATDDGEAPTGDPGAGDPPSGEGVRTRNRLSLPLVPVLLVVLLLLVAAAGFLWFTRTEESAVSTADYAAVLQTARSGIVDITSFDHLTLDDDIEQIRRVATGDLVEESVAELEEQREQIVQYEIVSNVEVVGAGVTRAEGDEATVMLLLQATTENAVAPQAEIDKWRIEVTLEKVGDRWLLSGISGR